LVISAVSAFSAVRDFGLGEKAEGLLAEDVADDACGLCEIEKESHGVRGSVIFAGKRR